MLISFLDSPCLTRFVVYACSLQTTIFACRAPFMMCRPVVRLCNGFNRHKSQPAQRIGVDTGGIYDAIRNVADCSFHFSTFSYIILCPHSGHLSGLLLVSAPPSWQSSMGRYIRPCRKTCIAQSPVPAVCSLRIFRIGLPPFVDLLLNESIADHFSTQ